MLDEQSKIYKVEGVDESAPAGPQKKRKQHTNGEEVSCIERHFYDLSLTSIIVSRTSLHRSLRRPASTPPYT